MAKAVGFRPTYSAASWEVVTPASRGMRKKMANVMALTTTSRKTVAIRRRMMNVITVPGTGARPGDRAPVPSPALWWRRQSSYRACLALDAQHAIVVHAVRLLDEHVGHVRGPVEQIPGVYPRQERRVLHDLHVDLAGEVVPRRVGGGLAELGEQVVDHRVVQLGQVGVARRADGGPVRDE